MKHRSSNNTSGGHLHHLVEGWGYGLCAGRLVRLLQGYCDSEVGAETNKDITAAILWAD